MKKLILIAIAGLLTVPASVRPEEPNHDLPVIDVLNLQRRIPQGILAGPKALEAWNRGDHTYKGHYAVLQQTGPGPNETPEEYADKLIDARDQMLLPASVYIGLRAADKLKTSINKRLLALSADVSPFKTSDPSPLENLRKQYKITGKYGMEAALQKVVPLSKRFKPSPKQKSPNRDFDPDNFLNTMFVRDPYPFESLSTYATKLREAYEKISPHVVPSFAEYDRKDLGQKVLGNLHGYTSHVLRMMRQL